MLLSFVLENPIPFTASYDSKLKQTWSPFVWSRILNLLFVLFSFLQATSFNMQSYFRVCLRLQISKSPLRWEGPKRAKYCTGYQLNANSMSVCLFLAFFFQLFVRFIFRWPYFALYLALVTSQCERRLNNEKLNHATPASKCFQLL